ncbi:MAG: hypothetical protein LBH57_03140 [Treponema sp.]|nr:hypothetical protein [Treponema sp.]
MKKSFSRTSAVWVRERQWAANQKIEEEDDVVIIYFFSTQYHKAPEWVLSRGCTARPFGPEKMVDDRAHLITEMRKMVRV